MPRRPDISKNVFRYPSDGATNEQSDTEAEIHEYIAQTPDALEEGFHVVEHKRKTKYGIIDFFARDPDR